jgi:membrane protease YdiL (CAAX protease family)
MSGELFLIISLGALLAFILWESWRDRPRALAKRIRSASGFASGRFAQEVALFVAGICFLGFGIGSLYSPQPWSTGSQRYLSRAIEAVFGPAAGGVLAISLGIGLLFLAGLSVRRKRDGAAKVSDAN